MSGIIMTSQTITLASPQQKLELVQKQVFLTLLACAILFITIQAAYATPTAMGTVLCNIVQMVYGNLGRGIATLAVVIIGVGATLGKTSWGLAMTVAVGIAVIFNAGGLVNLLGAGGTGC